MHLVRWNPFRDLSYLENQLNRLFDRTPDDDTVASPLLNGWLPLADVYESDSDFIVKVELPGVDPKDVDVRLEHNLLTVRGERRSENDREKDDYHRIERYFGTFSRTFTFPASIDADKIHADFKDGVLKITLPKVEEAKSKKIEIEAAA